MSENSQDEITLKEIFAILKEYFQYIIIKWVYVVISVLLGSGIGIWMCLQEKTTYTATLNFALEEDKGNSGGGISVLASQFGFDAGASAGGAFASQNIIGLMKSRSVVEKTLLRPVIIEKNEISLVEYFLRINGSRRKWTTDPIFNKIQFLPNSNRALYNRMQDSILGNMYNYFISPKSNFLTVTQKDKKVSIISIEVKSEDELFAKLFAENLADEISEFYAETKGQKAKMNLQILQRQTDSVRGELYAALSGVASANDDTYNLNPAYNIKKVPSSRKQIDVQANTAMLSQLVQNLELAKVTLRKETPLIQIIDKPVFPLNKYEASKRSYAITGGVIAGIISVFLIWIVAFLKKKL